MTFPAGQPQTGGIEVPRNTTIPAQAGWGVIAAVAALVASLLVLDAAPVLDLVKNAAGIGGKAEGIGRFVSAADKLVTPAVLAAAAVTPLALIAGGVMVMFGGRRGMTMIATSLGVLLFLGSVKGFIS